ncbi:hypothetical protein Bbelb_352440 [Branchiostoma belcheri]|nr:hypothetical protein Bbelb_352440 [Branchiostoma belcheri]
MKLAPTIGNSSDRIVFDRKRNPPDDQPIYVTRDHDIRLLGPTVFEGRVQVKRNGTWGSLCLRRGGGWSYSEATVVCRQLGFANGRVESRYRYGTGRMAVCNLDCRGNEDNIYECRHDDPDQPPQLKCEEPNCNNTYIGETSRPLKVRYKEHCRPSANGYSSAIFHHLQHNQGYLRPRNTLGRGLRVDLSGTWDLALPAPRTDNT